MRKDYTVGEIVNLVSVDCQRIQDAFTFSHEMLSYFSILTFGLYELWDVMGTSTVGCLVVIVILTSLNALFGKLQENYLKDILYYKGKRCKLLNEIIFGMKVIAINMKKLPVLFFGLVWTRRIMHLISAKSCYHSIDKREVR